MKVAELEGAALDAAVAKALGYSSSSRVPDELCGTWYAGESDGGVNQWEPSNCWEQAGPIIERERIAVLPHANGGWAAWPARGTGTHEAAHEGYGATALTAAMRAYVHSKLGDEVEPQ